MIKNYTNENLLFFISFSHQIIYLTTLNKPMYINTYINIYINIYT